MCRPNGCFELSQSSVGAEALRVVDAGANALQRALRAKGVGKRPRLFAKGGKVDAGESPLPPDIRKSSLRWPHSSAPRDRRRP